MLAYDCNYNLSALAVDMLRGVSGADLLYDEAHKKQRGFFRVLFECLCSSRLDCFYWKTGRGNIYTLTRSAKHPDAVQRTCFWLRDGEMIPLSDQQYFSFDDFSRDYLPDNVTIYIL